MYCVRKVTQDCCWVGASDRRGVLFENVFPVPNGMSYNAYLLLDQKTVLLDTVDKSVEKQFLENVEAVLDGRTLDYLVVTHMEPDHCAVLRELLLRYPEVTVVCNAKSEAMIRQFFAFTPEPRKLLVSEGDTLCTGSHTLRFFLAPMVHWPEVMVVYDEADQALYSADAFGTFGALPGSLFADELCFERDWLPEARRYYANIVGKYGAQVQSLLKKLSGCSLKYLCPLHGPVWRREIGWFLEKYQAWSTYRPEAQAVMIAYASVYGNTENAASLLASRLSEAGIRDIGLYDVSATHPSYLVSEAFRCSHLIFASTTYNAGIFSTMDTLLHELQLHNLQNRTVALLQNGSWAPTSGALMRKLFESMKNITLLDETVDIRSSVKPEQLAAIDRLADAIEADFCPAICPDVVAQHIDPKAMFTLTYGLFVLTTNDGTRDNGCIINTVMQVTDAPKRITIAVNKADYTHGILKKSGIFNLSVLTTDAPFALFQRFGFHSGRDTDKFDGFAQVAHSQNKLPYLTAYSNAFLSAKVVSSQEYETHTVFTAEITEAQALSTDSSVTYAYYFAHIKPKPAPADTVKKGWVCKICGYIYEGETLPPDFICPICKHGASDFEPLR
jgi:flavorubredoxin/flavin reductase (DIM6/NTAB) family NADH-FMN oxidoreductase RutF/rubredoxin